ncbi:MAG: NAD(P)H-dependent oxidoreductase [Wolinella sp.]
MNEFEKAMRFRHACKIFDENRKIPHEQMEWILDMGRISPSSFGLEPWHFLVISDSHLKEELRIACWDQPQVSTCSHFVVILVREPKHFKHDSEYLERSFRRRVGDDPERLEKIKDVFSDFEKNDLKPSLEDWAKMQAYLASANMMTAAAFVGVDSCPIEGFSYAELERILDSAVEKFDAREFGIAYCVAFGYRLNPQSKQLRWAHDEVITYV